MKQTFDKADEALDAGNPPNKLIFEDEAGLYDVDFGIKSDSGNPLYEEAFQLKSAGTPNAVKNRLSIGDARKIETSPSTTKIYELEMRTGTFDELEAIPEFWIGINTIKNSVSDVEIYIKNINGIRKLY